MTTTQTDLRALRRGPQPTQSDSTPEPQPAGSTTVIARPKARWATRLLIPAAVLLATGGLLAYAARDALQPRLAVHVAAAIPKSGVGAADTVADPVSSGGSEETPTDAQLGPVAVQAPGWIEPAPYAVSVPALAEGVVREVLVLEGERIEAGQVVARLIDEDARLTLRAADAAVAERSTDVARARAALATAESQVEVERTAAAELRDEV
ncbi:MAG: HlyD family secretion protein, partial [Phycisphaerales bacterium]|nr:HlyD family secretion protein [Phycisphaerales bacterium]